MKHNLKDGNSHEFMGYPYVVLNSGKCPICFGNFKKEKREFEKQVYDLVENEYTILDEYINAKTKIHIRHNCEKCNNNILYIAPNSFLRGTRCGVCKESKGEKVIRVVLQNTSQFYKNQYSFNNLLDEKVKRPMHFDFAIFNDKEKTKLKCLIEYDGEHHFKAVRFGGISLEIAENNLKTQKQRDNLKNKYCKDNNIPLIRIPYWEFDNIEQILSKEISDLDSMF
jgi:hypothetical protein